MKSNEIVPREAILVMKMHEGIMNAFVDGREKIEAWQKKFPKLETRPTEYLNKLKTQLGKGIEILKQPKTITIPQAVQLFSLWEVSRKFDVIAFFRDLEKRERMTKIAENHSLGSGLSSVTTSERTMKDDEKISSSAKDKPVLISDVIAKIAQDDKTFFNAKDIASDVIAEIAQDDKTFFNTKDIAELETLSSTESKRVVEKTQLQPDQAQKDRLSFLVKIIQNTGSIIFNMRINSGPGGNKLHRLIEKFLNPFLESCGAAFTVKTVIPNCSYDQKKIYLTAKKIYGNKFGEVKEHTMYRRLKDETMIHEMLGSRGTFVGNSGAMGVLYQDSLLGSRVHFRKHAKDLLEFTPEDMKDGDSFFAIAEILAPDTYVCQSDTVIAGNEFFNTDQPMYTSVVIMSGQKLKKQDELKDTLYVYLIGGKVTFSSDKNIHNVDLCDEYLWRWVKLVEVELKDIIPREGSITITEPELIIKIQRAGPRRYSLYVAPTNPETQMSFVTMSNKDGSVIASNNRMACYAPLFVIGMFASSGSSSSSSCSTAFSFSSSSSSSSSSSMMDMTV